MEASQARTTQSDSSADQLATIASTIEKLRLKLLDLSLRNPLLNFKFTKRTLRLIDELPDQVFSSLIDGRSFSFLPLPEPTQAELDNWEAATKPPEEFMLTSEELTEDESDVSAAKRRDIPKRDWAKHKGIIPEFDLPSDPGEGSRRSVHRDQKLQTLEWYDSLESSVRKLAQDARSAINETGSNMLFLGFGFLEWRETAESKTQLAPLILLPVELVRPEVRRGPRAYKLQANGDDVQINLALRQKLEADFGISLPEYEDGTALEEYFDAVKEAIGENRDWVVRRQIFLSLISQLGRLLLYNDLDPSNWPGRGIFAKNELVRSLLGAMSEDAIPTGAISYEVSEQTISQEMEVPLIDRADSSQLEAIRLVLEGKNLVVQGPPGTGKSQTITNLIAALVSEGKSVLFVAEKLAALQVVERRLSGLGFDPYCLELHSHKTQKKALLEALRTRFESHQPRVRSDLPKLKEKAANVRQSLNDYVTAVSANTSAGSSVADLLLGAGRHTLTIGETARTVDRLRLPELVSKGLSTLRDTPIDIEAREDLLTDLAKTAKEVSSDEPISASPWYGAGNLSLLESDRPLIEGQLNAFATALKKFDGLLAQLDSDYGLSLQGVSPERVLNMWESTKIVTTSRARIVGATKDFDALADHLSLRVSPSWKMLRRIVDLCEVAKTAPMAWLNYSNPEMDEPDADVQLARLRSEAEELSAGFDAIEEHLLRARTSHIGDADLLLHSSNLATISPIARFFSKSWKEAKSAIVSLGGNFSSEKPDVWALRLAELAGLLQRREALATDKAGKRLFDQLFDGIDTEFAVLDEIVSWRRRARKALSGDAEADRLADWLLSQDFRSIERVASLDLNSPKAELQWATDLGGSSVMESYQSDFWTGLVYAFAPDEFRPLLTAEEGGTPEAAIEIIQKTGEAANGLVRARHSVDTTLGRNTDADWLAIEDEMARVHRQLNRLDNLPTWIRYARYRKAALDAATAPLIRAAEEGYPLFEDLAGVWRYCAYRSSAQAVFKASPPLHEKNGSERDQERKIFRALDESIMEARRSEIAAKAHIRRPPPGRSSARVGDLTEMALLSHQWGLQRPRMSIRNLMDRSGNAIQALKPCFMMGPLSVAQYLKPGGLQFDVVIMDEASQMRPEDALSAVARGKQLVVVGDDKQLPPTNFFNKIGLEGDGTEDYDEEVVGEKEESILSLAASKFDSRMLRWHYRSRHESLIAFSNSWFYDNKLIVYPTPNNTGDRLGIDFNYVPTGWVARGVNDEEARTVAKAAIQHMRARPEQSLIVVAMNSAQRDRIRKYIDEQTRNDVSIVRAEEDSSRGEPFDVKNLENVQGDERDVVLLSMTYGPSPETGKVYQRFGPINLEHGHRRLNVLFSRARERMIVFSSMKASEVLVGENSKLGVRALSGFLEYSETGILPGRVVPVGSGREPDSDFEIAVAEALRRKGYEVVAQLGVDGFFLDLAVKDPEASHTYLIGIECDVASYHSSKSARDRDRLRQDILEGLGWRIERIWSTDWFQEPGRELSRIIDAIEDEKARRIAQRQRPMSPERRSPPSLEEDNLNQDGAEPEEDTEYLDPDDTLLEEAPPQERRMSRSEARDVLIRLREDTIKPSMPEVPPERGLLRKVMLETLLEHLPQDETEFRDMIPLKLREGTDSEQFSTFGKIVFRILRQVSA